MLTKHDKICKAEPPEAYILNFLIKRVFCQPGSEFSATKAHSDSSMYKIILSELENISKMEDQEVSALVPQKQESNNYSLRKRALESSRVQLRSHNKPWVCAKSLQSCLLATLWTVTH